MSRKFWRFADAAASGPKKGQLYLYGNIGPDDGLSWFFDETSPKMFKQELDDLGAVDELEIFINSDGGDTFAGQAIFSMLRRYDAQKTVHVDGLAASIASVIAMAGDTVIMPSNAMMMIHEPWTIVAGNSTEMRKTAETLDQVRESIMAAYIGKTGMKRDKLIPLLEAETWMTAKDAVELGFADVVEDTKKISASLITDRVFKVDGQVFNLERFSEAPDRPWDAAPDDTTPTIRQAERALRDGGLSQSMAKRILAEGWPNETPSDDGVPRDAADGFDGETLRLRLESQRLIARNNARRLVNA